ncbi:MAG: TadE/TadG family type IV pilus assembly protein [Candidatus Nanopelagicales bacterium]
MPSPEFWIEPSAVSPVRSSTHRDDRGSAVTEFALVTPLLLLVALSVIQLILVLHVRSTLTAAAAEGARTAALSGSALKAGEARTKQVLDQAIGGSDAIVSASRVQVSGSPAIRVRVTAALPLFGMLGPEVLTVEGHSFVERR